MGRSDCKRSQIPRELINQRWRVQRVQARPWESPRAVMNDPGTRRRSCAGCPCWLNEPGRRTVDVPPLSVPSQGRPEKSVYKSADRRRPPRASSPLSSGRSSESSGEGKQRRGSNREGQSPPPRELSDIGFGSSRRSLARQGFPSLRAGRGPRGPGSAASSGARSSEAPERYPPAGQSPGGLVGARQISEQWHCRGLSPEIQPLAVRIVKDPVWFTRDLRRFT